MARTEPAELEARAAKLRDLAARDPEDATTWFTLGRTLFELRRFREASEALRSALQHDPRYTAAHRDLGRALLEDGEGEEAARVLRAALPLAHESGDLQTEREMETFLRRAERVLGVAQGASAAPERSAAPEPTAPAVDAETRAAAKALYREGFAHFANDRFDEAIALYERAIERDPGLAIAWNGLSLAHRQRGDLEAAIEAGRRLIELEPDDALSHTNLSILYMRRGMIPEAEEEKAIAMQLQLRAGSGR
jgi:superkiller protein 3